MRLCSYGVREIGCHTYHTQLLNIESLDGPQKHFYFEFGKNNNFVAPVGTTMRDDNQSINVAHWQEAE